ncbi:MAG: hypothetical protein M3P08_20410 [Thermoproteota archaeon]|nr:hypothetical protein [Thermoproteota archaeon]
MTKNKYVVRTGDSVEDDEDELKKHKELIILVELVKYCGTIGVDRIRYRKLRRISNDRLAALTGGNETDFGGNFEVYLSNFEKEYHHETELIKRIREGKRITYIVPAVQKIAKLFGKFKLNNLFEEEAIIKKPIPIEYEDNYLPHMTDGSDTGRLIDFISPPGVYTARYYYRNGHVIFLNQDPESFFHEIDTDPFYKITNHLCRPNSKSLPDNKEDSPIFISDKLNIRLLSSSERNLRLSEMIIRQLLKLNENISSEHPERNFKILMEFEGSSDT